MFNFKSLLNKCTENNHQLITKDILLLLEEGTGTKEDLLNTIKDISINQYDFIDCNIHFNRCLCCLSRC